MRITVHVKGNYERAVRLVVDPKTDTWDSFCVDMLKQLKITPASYTIQRASTKSNITSLDHIRWVDGVWVGRRGGAWGCCPPWGVPLLLSPARATLHFKHPLPLSSPNDLLTVDPVAVVVKIVRLTESPLSVATTKHLRIRNLAYTNQSGPTFIVKCAKKGRRSHRRVLVAPHPRPCIHDRP